MAAAKQREVDDHARMEDVAGNVFDALRGFINVSIEWKTEADRAFGIDPDRARKSPFVARALSLSVLTSGILKTAFEIPRSLMAGALTSTAVNWRHVTEAKNIALMIDLDVFGPMGFLWLNYNMIEQAKVSVPGSGSQRVAAQGKQILEEAGFEYDSRSDPWAIIDGKRYANSIDRSEYVWRHRKFPPEASQQLRREMADAEQLLIRASNMMAHPTLLPQDILQDKLYALIFSTTLDSMAVMMAYKNAASEVVGWPSTKTVGDQFHVYSAKEELAGELSLMVKDMYDHCSEVFREHFLG